MSGAEVARRVRMRYPELPIVFVTGYADHALLDGISGSLTIRKPFDQTVLAGTIADALISSVQMIGEQRSSRGAL